MIVDYTAAMRYLDSYVDFEKIPGVNYAGNGDPLPRVRLLLHELGNPQRAYPALIVAGTKGKGSTCAMLASILRASGRRVGLYTQPHLHSYRERIRVDDDLIPPASVGAQIERISAAVDTVHRTHPEVGRLTWYELGTALAFCHFAERVVDIAVLEVGLGGRLDATNVVDPLVSVIASISLDHTQVLGATEALIAREKAGIVKPGRPVISAPQSDEALGVLRAVCAERGSTLLVCGEGGPWPWSVLRSSPLAAIPPSPMVVTLGGTRREYGPLAVPLLGRVQATNAALAVGVCELLDSSGFSITATAIVDGLRATRWPGRLEVVSERPLTVVDGAHNGESARELGIALQEFFAPRRRVCVLGVSSDKDVRAIVRGLMAATRSLIVTKSRHARSARPEEIAACVREAGGVATIEPDVALAITAARAQAGPDGLVCATGSLFVVAEAREWAGLGTPD